MYIASVYAICVLSRRCKPQMLSDPPHGLDGGLNIFDGAVVVARILRLVGHVGFERLWEPALHHPCEGGDVDNAVVEEMVYLGHFKHNHLAVALNGIPGDGAALFCAVLLHQSYDFL